MRLTVATHAILMQFTLRWVIFFHFSTLLPLPFLPHPPYISLTIPLSSSPSRKKDRFASWAQLCRIWFFFVSLQFITQSSVCFWQSFQLAILLKNVGFPCKLLRCCFVLGFRLNFFTSTVSNKYGWKRRKLEHCRDFQVDHSPTVAICESVWWITSDIWLTCTECGWTNGYGWLHSVAMWPCHVIAYKNLLIEQWKMVFFRQFVGDSIWIDWPHSVHRWTREVQSMWRGWSLIRFFWLFSLSSVICSAVKLFPVVNFTFVLIQIFR